MKVLILSDPASIHTVKWVNALSGNGLSIHLFGMGTSNPLIEERVVQHIVDISPSRTNLLEKLKYLTAVPSLLKIYKETKPDIVHAHFASSYGLLGRFLNHTPYIVSLWGTDVFEFPLKSFIHRKALQHVLDAADLVLSTSAAMKAEAFKYTENAIFVTPFGVDIDIFHPGESNSSSGAADVIFQFGIVKALEKAYGIEVLIRAYALVRSRSTIKSKLTIVGGGSQMQALKGLIDELGLTDTVELTGIVPHSAVMEFHRRFDVEVFPSLVNESFGVSVVEAMACGTPVIVSDVNGFKEVVENGRCGLVVKKGSVTQLADAMVQMMEDKNLRNDYAQQGLSRVQDEYRWNDNVSLMISHYNQLLISPK